MSADQEQARRQYRLWEPVALAMVARARQEAVAIRFVLSLTQVVTRGKGAACRSVCLIRKSAIRQISKLSKDVLLMAVIGSRTRLAWESLAVFAKRWVLALVVVRVTVFSRFPMSLVAPALLPMDVAEVVSPHRQGCRLLHLLPANAKIQTPVAVVIRNVLPIIPVTLRLLAVLPVALRQRRRQDALPAIAALAARSFPTPALATWTRDRDAAGSGGVLLKRQILRNRHRQQHPEQQQRQFPGNVPPAIAAVA